MDKYEYEFLKNQCHWQSINSVEQCQISNHSSSTYTIFHMSISRRSFGEKCLAGKLVATSRKSRASSISSPGIGLHMAQLQLSKTKSLRVAKHWPRQTSCLASVIHHKSLKTAITLSMCTLHPFDYRHKFVQSNWLQHKTFP